MMTSSDEIRETFLSFFERAATCACPSASLVPATFDASVLLTTRGNAPAQALLPRPGEAAAPRS